MSEAIEWLKLYMDNNKTGNKVTDKYLEVVNALIESSIQLKQENTQLKQQLKDKDENISKVKEYIEKYVNKELEYLYKKNDDFHKGKDFGDGSYRCAIQDVQAIRGNILEILESNKED